MKHRLESLRTCLADTDKESIEDLGLGLLWGWRNWGPQTEHYWVSPWTGERFAWRAGIDWPPVLVDFNIGKSVPNHLLPDSVLPWPPPAEYIDSLDQDLAACAASAITTDRKKRSSILKAIAKDIRIKAKDCKKFGMGRLVPVQVSTLKGGRAENGWEILYKWSPVSSIPTSELSIPGLSSPAVVNLPPGGTYLIRARRPGADGKPIMSETRTITISAEPVIECQIPVP